eukprot:COSAG01_NODE_580_length_15231_cov_6.793220_12_plen_203_part_00
MHDRLQDGGFAVIAIIYSHLQACLRRAAGRGTQDYVSAGGDRNNPGGPLSVVEFLVLDAQGPGWSITAAHLQPRVLRLTEVSDISISIGDVKTRGKLVMVRGRAHAGANAPQTSLPAALLRGAAVALHRCYYAIMALLLRPAAAAAGLPGLDYDAPIGLPGPCCMGAEWRDGYCKLFRIDWVFRLVGGSPAVSILSTAGDEQ